MSSLFIIFSTIAFVLFIIGLFNPKISLFWMNNKEKQKRGVSSGIYLSVWFILGIIGGVLADDADEVGKASGTSAIQTTNAVNQENVTESNWTYSEERDEMSGKMMYFATCTSTNMKEFEFPYGGGSYLYLTVRNINGQNDVLLRISKGQVMPSVPGIKDEYIRFKFDGGEPVKYYFGNSADGDMECAFISSSQSSPLIKKIKAAKEVKIDIPIFQEGRPVFNFDIAGLKWNH